MKKSICPSFTVEQISAIREILNRIDDAEFINSLTIKNSGKLKTSAGNATTNLMLKTGIIKMNKRLFETTCGIEEFKNTFSHELAHIVANLKHNIQCGHDYRWQNEHRKLGGDAKRCHTYEVNHLRPKRKTFTYKCACRKINLSAVRHNKILRGARFSCALCGETITKI